RMPCRSKDNLVPRRGPAMGVGGRVRRFVVRAKIRLNLDDPPRYPTGSCPSREHFSKQQRRNPLSRVFEKCAFQQSASRRRFHDW
ncbi:MAG TPA: hypothetical protein VME23_22495, partial [Terracidiphilus sp.]|nr:hypothetical protein [Terracidiphilus sp.]